MQCVAASATGSSAKERLAASLGYATTLQRVPRMARYCAGIGCEAPRGAAPPCGQCVAPWGLAALQRCRMAPILNSCRVHAPHAHGLRLASCLSALKQGSLCA